MKRFTLQYRKLTIRQRILLGIGAVVLLTAAATLWQYFAWQGYVSHSDRMYTEARDNAVRQLREADQPESIQALADTLTQKSSDELCHAPVLTNIQSKVVSQTREYQSECQQRKDALLAVAVSASQLADRLRAEQRVAEIFQVTADKLKGVEEGDYEARRKIWQQAKGDLSGLDIDENYGEVLQSQLAAIDTIVERYGGVIEANKDEKRSLFDDAAVDLREAYGTLSVVGEESKKRYRSAAEQLYDAISEL